jgi:hypothetical protein
MKKTSLLIAMIFGFTLISQSADARGLCSVSSRHYEGSKVHRFARAARKGTSLRECLITEVASMTLHNGQTCKNRAYKNTYGTINVLYESLGGDKYNRNVAYEFEFDCRKQ